MLQCIIIFEIELLIRVSFFKKENIQIACVFLSKVIQIDL